MLPDHCHRRVVVHGAADLPAALQTASELADGTLSDEETARLRRIVSAVVDHLAGRPAGGTLLLRRYGRREGVECVAFDRGPGFPDPDAALAEGEAGGLGAIRPITDHFAFHSTPEHGSAVLVRVARQPGSAQLRYDRQVIACGAVMVAGGDAEVCADGWFFRPDGLAAVINGTAGSAESAALARRVETVVSATVTGIPAPMVIGAIRQTVADPPGTVVAALKIDGRTVDYTALGTVPGSVVRKADLTSLSARWAMIGYNPHVPGCVHLMWGPGDHVVLSSEGCGRLPGLFLKRGLRDVDPTLAAAILMRDGDTPPGDHTVVVLRNVSPPEPEDGLADEG